MPTVTVEVHILKHPNEKYDASNVPIGNFRHWILKYSDHDRIHKGLYCVSSQTCTNKWEQLKMEQMRKNGLKTVRKG